MKKFTIYYFLFLLFFFSFFCSGVMDSQDGLQYLAVARNIYYKGELTAPPYEYDTGKNIHMTTYVGRDGSTYSPTGLGYSIALVPAVAVTDFVYNFYDVTPSIHFPLQSEWLILLTASFTNAFFGALLGVVLYKYMRLLKINHKNALLLSFIGMVSTNLFVYTKHSFAHMMFIAFLVLAFYFVKHYSQKKNTKYLIFSGISMGIVAITYNQTFLLTIPPYLLYLFLLLKPKLNVSWARIIKKLLFIFVGTLPFILTYFWFENLRAKAAPSRATSAFFVSYAKNTLSDFPLTVFFEGLWGQLFSPGRSIFLYSPVLILPIIFWQKLKKNIKPEVAVFISLSFLYIFFYASQYSEGKPGQGIVSLWLGESSWGPRYLTPLIPFGILLVGYLFKKLTKKTKLLIFAPLIAVGVYVQILGILMPYQIKFQELDSSFVINRTQYKSFHYTNLLPRYSPLIMMSKKLVKLAQNFPKTLDTGPYNVEFYDGIDLPFNVGPERWRSIEKNGYISFNNLKESPIKNLSFDLINHPLAPEASSSAQIQLFLNGEPLLDSPASWKVTERRTLKVDVPEGMLKESSANELVISIEYSRTDVFEKHSQIFGLITFYLNEHPINKESIDVPYVSELSQSMTQAKYKNWGRTSKDPWRLWQLHTQVFERTPDFWWIQPFYYWDFPKYFYAFMFSINLAGLTFFGIKVIKNQNQN